MRTVSPDRLRHQEMTHGDRDHSQSIPIVSCDASRLTGLRLEGALHARVSFMLVVLSKSNDRLS